MPLVGRSTKDYLTDLKSFAVALLVAQLLARSKFLARVVGLPRTPFLIQKVP